MVDGAVTSLRILRPGIGKKTKMVFYKSGVQVSIEKSDEFDSQ